MKRTIFSFLGILTLLVLSETVSSACTCGSSSPGLSLKKQVREALNGSQAVFAGKVVEVTENPQTLSVVVKLKVERIWKGSLPGEIEIVTGRGGGDCGYGFEIGERYLVYAYGSNARSLGTNICQRTAKVSDAANDLKFLGKGKVVQKTKA